jgi:hypothetical protein
MSWLGRLAPVSMVTLGILSAGAVGASAQTYYVNATGGLDTHACTSPAEPCLTIGGAIKKSEAITGPNTIEVASHKETAGLYHETLALLSPKDAGLTINGEEPGVVIEGKKAPAVIAETAITVTFSNLKLKATNEAAVKTSAIFVEQAAMTLDNVAVENESSVGVNGVELKESGSLTMNGGRVEMEGGASGWAVDGVKAPIALTGVNILNGAQAADSAGGVSSEKGSLSLTNTQISVESSPPSAAVNTELDTSVAIANVAIKQNGPEVGALIEGSPLTVNGLRVEMLSGASSTLPAVVEGNEGTASSFSHLEISGSPSWTGPGLSVAGGGDLTLTDSRVTESPLSSSAALRYDGTAAGRGLFVQRSVLQAGANAKPGAVVSERADATFDSSEILGGRNGVFFDGPEATSLALNLSASTVDAGEPGIAADPAGTTGVEAVAKGSSGGVTVAIQGSIVLEQQTASFSPGDTASIGCAYSAVPSQSQGAGGGNGAINCAAGAAGNTDLSPLSSLFPEPLSGFQLAPGSSAVDSVPAGALTLPFGLTPSTTDAAGNPRVVDGNGDCLAAQDKGALELQGHGRPCTPPPGAAPAKGLITSLSLTPSVFSAAPKGATISAKRKYGTRISWVDSQAAKTTFTVLRALTGRTHGHSCKRPSKNNAHGKRCTYYVAVGSFTHVDRAGGNSLHFSGRFHGRRLAGGSYRLQAVARDLAGLGPAARRSFKIR